MEKRKRPKQINDNYTQIRLFICKDLKVINANQRTKGFKYNANKRFYLKTSLVKKKFPLKGKNVKRK